MTAASDTEQGADWNGGEALIARRAERPGVFDSNELRAELRELGFGRWTTGRVFQIAESHGIIRQVGVIKSTDGPTRGAYVRRWIGTRHRAGLSVLIPTAEAVTIPVTRDRDGRFTQHDGDPYGTPAMFEVTP